ncbi:MAG TPA: GNAT family N-acetyltransferase [Terracidiphilus sp.]|nr:GNAT family N-acetyltransferase [Terracidiphilus sp.]
MTTQTADSKNAIAIRPMQMHDAPAVCELIAQLGYERSVDDVREWIQSIESTIEMQAAFVACLNENLLGWIEVSAESRLQSAPFALIGGLVVREGSRSLGIGRLLCAAAEQWARERGLKKVRVTSRTTRDDAHRFYLRNGFEVTKTSKVFEKLLRE